MLEIVKLIFLGFCGDCGGRTFTAGGAIETGLERGFRVGDGDALEVLRGGWSLESSTTFSLPLAARSISPNPTSSILSGVGLEISL